MIVINMLLLKNLISQKTSENFAARLAQANLASKNDIPSFAKMADFDKNKNVKNKFK